MVKHDPYAPLRLPDFRRILSSWVLAGFASKMQTLAVGWYVYERTGSALAIGWVGLAQFAPALLLFLPAGHLVDRYERRLLMVGSFCVAACASLLMLYTAWAEASLGWLYLACAINGSAQAVQRPARVALMPTIVPLATLPSAFAWATGTFQAATFGGPVLSGIIIAVSGNAAINFGVNSLLFFLALLLAMRIRTRERPQPAGRSLNDLLAGVRHVFATPVILGTLLLDLASALFRRRHGAAAHLRQGHPAGGAGGPGLDDGGAGGGGALCMGITLGHMKPSQKAAGASSWPWRPTVWPRWCSACPPGFPCRWRRCSSSAP